MIKNEKEYRVTKAAAQNFQAALTNFDERPQAHPGIDPRFIPKMRESMESELEILSEDLKTYEQLRRRRRNRLKVAELRSLPLELIRARISAGLSEAELAKRLGLKPQQIQRYEEHDYETASFARILEIAQALDQAAHERA